MLRLICLPPLLPLFLNIPFSFNTGIVLTSKFEQRNRLFNKSFLEQLVNTEGVITEVVPRILSVYDPWVVHTRSVMFG